MARRDNNVVVCDSCGELITPHRGLTIAGNIHIVGDPNRKIGALGGGIVGNNIIWNPGEDPIGATVVRVSHYHKKCLFNIISCIELEE